MEISYGFDDFLKSAETFVKKIDAAKEKEFEWKMNKLREIEHHMQAINSLAPTEENEGVVIARYTCEHVLYSKYVEAESKATVLSKVVSDVEISKNLPELLQVKGTEIKAYVDEIKAHLQEVSNVIGEIAKMINRIENNDYNLSRKEKINLKMKTLELDKGLEICSDYQERAAKALKELKSDSSSYHERQKNAAFIKVGCVVVAAVGGGFAAAAALPSFAVSATTGGTVGGFLGGGTAGFINYRSVFALFIGAAVSVPLVYLVLKRWFAERQFFIELFSIHRKYRDLINESQSMCFNLNYDLRK